LEDAELETVYEGLCEGIKALHTQSEIGGGRARLLFYALAGYLEEHGMLDDMKSAANYMAQNEALRQADLGAQTH